MRDILRLIQERHSARVAYDAGRALTANDMQRLLEAARWAPTAHNMQNFEIVAVDDKATLADIGAIRTEISPTFLRENYQQMSFSESELLHKKTGVLASMFPPAWQKPDCDVVVPATAEPALLRASMHDCPALLIALYDPSKRAPASEGDVLGFMSLGCVMQNIWLAAEDLGIGMQVLSTFSSEGVERQVKPRLGIPVHLKIAFACRLGFAAKPPLRHLRVRRPVSDFAHANRYGTHFPADNQS